MLKVRIGEDMKLAMKSGDTLKLGTIRMLRSAIKDKEIELGSELSDSLVEAQVAKMIKQRRDAAVQFSAGGRKDLESVELAEIKCLEAYLPEQISEQELLKIIDQLIAEVNAGGMRDMGKVMAGLKAKVLGKADMGMVSALVKQRLGAIES
ncbi:MAG: GatB/YqeY domain-containing protein [Mariprofundaceae bacterium]